MRPRLPGSRSRRDVRVPANSAGTRRGGTRRPSVPPANFLVLLSSISYHNTVLDSSDLAAPNHSTRQQCISPSRQGAGQIHPPEIAEVAFSSIWHGLSRAGDA